MRLQWLRKLQGLGRDWYAAKGLVELMVFSTTPQDRVRARRTLKRAERLLLEHIMGRRLGMRPDGGPKKGKKKPSK